MARRRRASTKKGPKHYNYYFRVLEWYVSYRNTYEWKVTRERDEDVAPWARGEVRETKVEHCNYIDLIVELLNPVKSVLGGEFTVMSGREVEMETDFYPKNIRYEKRPQDDGGGALWARRHEDRTHNVMSGLLRVDECCFLALVQVLASGRPVIIDLSGEEFYRNKARISSIGWFMEGAPNTQEDLEWAIEQSRLKSK